ncbi:MAG: hypothetical protein QM808_13625 [Steroidobacteraceae bacterium]
MKRMATWLTCTALIAGGQVLAQVVAPDEEDLAGVQAQFQDLVRGKSDKIDQSRGMGAGGPPGGMRQGPKAIANPATDPRDLRGQWSAGMGGGAPAPAAADAMGAGGPPAGGPPGAGPNSAPAAAPGAAPAGGMAAAAAGMGAGGLGLITDRPGPQANTKIDANRICLVTPGSEIAAGKYYQNDKELVIVMDNELRVRRIRFNAEHANPVVPSYNGDSVGKWDGNTLVVDTVGLKGAFGKTAGNVEDGYFKLLLTTPTLHVVERFTKSADGSQLTIERTFEDAATKMQPYTRSATLSFTEDNFGTEGECEDFGDAFGPAYKAQYTF